MNVQEFIEKYGLTVGGYLDLWGTGITSLPDGLTVGGSLNLRGTGITSLPDGLTVGGSLDLWGTGITSLPEDLTVGGSLNLRGTGITSLPEDLTVGGSLDLEGCTGITDKAQARVNHTLPDDFFPLRWRGGQYISVDGIFSEVISQKGNIWKVRAIGKKEVTYLVTDGHGRWSHGDTLQAAKDDLVYKIGNRDKSAYANLTMDSVLTCEDAIQAYRVITGACAAGTRRFVESLAEVKGFYTIHEICQLTKGQFGATDFAQFFTNNACLRTV